MGRNALAGRVFGAAEHAAPVVVRRRDAAGLVLRQSARLVCLGLTIGLVATVPATRLLEASLVGVERLDFASYAIS